MEKANHIYYEKNNYNKEKRKDKKIYGDLIKKGYDLRTEVNKIEKISDVTANNARLIHKEYKPFLPVIISGTDRDLNHGFVLGLMEALKKNDLIDIAPDSDYSKAVEVIENWKNKYKKVYKEFENILTGYETNVKELEKSLKSMNRNGLEIFKKVYPELTAGSEFRPMVQDNAMTLYREISIALKEHGYGGIYIIFDEFSKYIEGHERETFAYDMKILQDICELANNSKEQQIHITFVAHKSIKEYGNALPQDMINAFKGVEGRLKEIRFIVSAQNNYELLQHVIKKKGTDDYLFPWNDIDDSGIKTKNFCKNLLKFELDQNSILQMLVGHTLYNDSSVVIRELVQNGLDAIKLQNKIENKNHKKLTEGKIEVEWDSENRVLSFSDNGTGMTVFEIENYLLRVGTSKYSSKSFQKEYPEFVSISRFGIGILTCFLVANDIEI